MSTIIAKLVNALVDLVTGKTRAFHERKRREREAAAQARRAQADIEARAHAGRQKAER